MSRFWISALVSAMSLTMAHAQSEEIKKRVDALVQTLGDENIESRTKAVGDLVKIGRPALEALRQAAARRDAEVKALAKQAIEGIEWRGVTKLKAYVGEMYADGATVKQAKLKALSKWFPEIRFYEVKVAAAAAAAPAAAFMGMQQAPRSLFAVAPFEAGFTRVMVKGVYCAQSFGVLLRKQRIVLDDADTALDFSLAFVEAQGVGTPAGAIMASIGGASRFEKIDEGWEFHTSNGTSLIFKTDKENVLLGIRSTSMNYFQRLGFGGGSNPSAEKLRLELEKLRLEVELLERKLDKQDQENR